MQHLLVFLNLVASGVGIVAATLAYQISRRSRLQLHGHFFHYLLLLNAIVGIYLAASYLAVNVDLERDGKAARAVSVLLQTAGVAVVAAWLYRLIAILRGIRGQETPARFRLVWTVGFSILTASVLAAGFLWSEPAVQRTAFLLVYLLYLLMMLTATVVALHAFVACGSLSDARRRHAGRTHAAIHLLLLLLVPVIAVMPAPLAQSAASFWLILSSLVPLVHLARSVLGERPSSRQPSDSSDRMRRFASRFGVSPREVEIVSLALDGKTNSEIGKILFISPHTVRNHIHSVYKKAGTRNRVELANLILEQESMSHQPG